MELEMVNLVEVFIGFVFWLGNVIYFFHEARIIKRKMKENAGQRILASPTKVYLQLFIVK